MEIHATMYAFRCLGHEPTLSLAAWYLTQQTRRYGEAVNEIWISAYFPEVTATEVGISTEREFLTTLSRLPQVRVNRKKQTADIKAITQFQRPVVNPWKTYLPSPSQFRQGLYELQRMLALLEGKFKKADDFALENFLQDVDLAVQRPPSTQGVLTLLRQSHDEYLESKNMDMDPWERVDVNWEEYHRNARKLLNDPFYWEQSNDLAPNGNDTGADVLIEYSDWREEHKRGDPTEWLQSLLEAWEVDLALAPSSASADVLALLERSDLSVSTWDDAAIGLAFACLKVDGKLSETVAALALCAVERQSIDVVIEKRGWRDANERKTALARIAAALLPYARQ